MDNNSDRKDAYNEQYKLCLNYISQLRNVMKNNQELSFDNLIMISDELKKLAEYSKVKAEAVTETVNLDTLEREISSDSNISDCSIKRNLLDRGVPILSDDKRNIPQISKGGSSFSAKKFESLLRHAKGFLFSTAMNLMRAFLICNKDLLAAVVGHSARNTKTSTISDMTICDGIFDELVQKGYCSVIFICDKAYYILTQIGLDSFKKDRCRKLLEYNTLFRVCSLFSCEQMSEGVLYRQIMIVDFLTYLFANHNISLVEQKDLVLTAKLDDLVFHVIPVAFFSDEISQFELFEKEYDKNYDDLYFLTDDKNVISAWLDMYSRISGYITTDGFSNLDILNGKNQDIVFDDEKRFSKNVSKSFDLMRNSRFAEAWVYLAIESFDDKNALYLKTAIDYGFFSFFDCDIDDLSFYNNLQLLEYPFTHKCLVFCGILHTLYDNYTDGYNLLLGRFKNGFKLGDVQEQYIPHALLNEIQSFFLKNHVGFDVLVCVDTVKNADVIARYNDMKIELEELYSKFDSYTHRRWSHPRTELLMKKMYGSKGVLSDIAEQLLSGDTLGYFSEFCDAGNEKTSEFINSIWQETAEDYPKLKNDTLKGSDGANITRIVQATIDCFSEYAMMLVQINKNSYDYAKNNILIRDLCRKFIENISSRQDLLSADEMTGCACLKSLIEKLSLALTGKDSFGKFRFIPLLKTGLIQLNDDLYPDLTDWLPSGKLSIQNRIDLHCDVMVTGWRKVIKKDYIDDCCDDFGRYSIICDYLKATNQADVLSIETQVEKNISFAQLAFLNLLETVNNRFNSNELIDRISKYAEKTKNYGFALQLLENLGGDFLE